MKDTKEKQFEQDWRKTNPALHLHYTKTAVKHLRIVDKCIDKMFNEPNLNMLDFACVLLEERAKKVKSDAAYAEAQEILDSIGLGKAGH